MSVTDDDQLVFDISSLLKHSTINDVTIILNDDVNVDANKVVLIARSKFFSRLFQRENPVPTKIKMEISASKESLNLAIKYLYTGKMEFSSLSFCELLDLTNLLKFMEMDVFSDVEAHIIEKVEGDQFELTTLLKSLNVLEKYELADLISSVLKYIDVRFEDVAKLLEVKDISSDFLERLLKKRLHQNVLIEAYGEADFEEEPRSDNEFGSSTESNCEEDTVDINKQNVFTVSAVIVEDKYQVSEFNFFINWLSGNVECGEPFKKRIAKLFDLSKFPPEYLVSQVRSSKLYDQEEIFNILGQSAALMKSEIKGLKRKRMEMEQEINSLKNNYKELEVNQKKLLDEKKLKLEKRKRGYISGYF